jgi:hypothetical protein
LAAKAPTGAVPVSSLKAQYLSTNPTRALLFRASDA